MARQEQSLGVQQVNQAVASIDQITQQNAALVEQATAEDRSGRRSASARSNLRNGAAAFL